MKRLINALIGSAVLLMFAGNASSTERIINGGFETGDFTGWTTTPAPVGSNFGVSNAAAHTGNFGAYFGATGTDFDSISQTFSTLAGSLYTVSIFYEVAFTNQMANNEFRIFFDGVLLYDNVNANPGFITLTFNNLVATTGSTTLLIQARNAPFFDYIDDVSVDGAVPEPGTISLLALGGVGLLGRAWRRAKR